MHKCGWTRWWSSSWKWDTTLSTNASRMSKDAAVLTEDQVNTGRMAWLQRRNNRRHTELGRTKERRDEDEGKRRKRASGTRLHLVLRELKRRGEIPVSMVVHWKGSHLKLLGSEPTNLWPSERSESQTDKPCCCISYLGQGCKSTGVHGSWELRPWELQNDPRVRTLVDYGESAGWDGMEEICCIDCFLRKVMRP